VIANQGQESKPASSEAIAKANYNRIGAMHARVLKIAQMQQRKIVPADIVRLQQGKVARPQMPTIPASELLAYLESAVFFLASECFALRAGLGKLLQEKANDGGNGRATGSVNESQEGSGSGGPVAREERQGSGG
jgi:hypothetical protein